LSAATAFVAELVLLVLAMLTVRIVTIVASSVRPLAPELDRKMMQFVFIVHALRQLTPLWQ
jgi:hypothetical protein